MMMPEEIIQSNEVQDLIPSNNLILAAQRQNRDTSDHLDHNLEPQFPNVQQAVDLRQGGDNELPGGIRPPADIPEGFDPSSLEPQDDGQFCVFKTIPVEGLIQKKTFLQTFLASKTWL